MVHVGVGGFHRAHQGVYFDDLAARGALDWGVLGVSLRGGPGGRAVAAQDGLYTLVERGQHDRARVIGCCAGVIDASEQPDHALASLARAATNLVTLTVTGGAYKVEPGTRSFDEGDAEVRRDLEDPHLPCTVPGFLTEALRRRRDAGLGPLTIASCDNVPANGRVARAAVLAYAGLLDDSLARWIELNVSFPSSVVDRITPGHCPATRASLAHRYGIDDPALVVAEPFRQWILEDDFAGKRPPLEAVGVELVADVGEHETVKKRLLNGAHTAMSYLSVLLGIDRTDEAMEDPRIRGLVERVMDEVTPLLAQPAGVSLDEYRTSLIERFSNRAVADPVTRLCARGSVKMPSYLLPSLREAIAADLPHEALTLAVAAWFRYLRGIDYDGRRIDVVDPRAADLTRIIRTGGPRALLSERSIFGDLLERGDFVRRLEGMVWDLDRLGPGETADRVLRTAPAVAA